MSPHGPKGVIALDIDGTLIATVHDAISDSVIDALQSYVVQGWQIMFITGRPFSWSYSALASLPFPYLLAVQNGATLIDMPSKQVIIRNGLTKDSLIQLEQIARKYHTDFCIYSGFENNDRCYYRGTFFPQDVLSYALTRAASLGENWELTPSFSHMPISFFSSAKFFSHAELASLISRSAEKNLGFHAPINRDPFDPDYSIIQITHRWATKGNILREFMHLNNWDVPIIAAGDDQNDESMLQEATVKIVMQNAPKNILEIADVIAPPATKLGIIQGLQNAMKRIT